MCIIDDIGCFDTTENCTKCLNNSIKDLLGLTEGEMYAFDCGSYNQEIETVIELISNSAKTKLQIKFVHANKNVIHFIVIRKNINGEEKIVNEHETNELGNVLKKYIRSKFIIVNL